MQMRGRRRNLIQNTVDSVTDLQSIFERLDMDITGPFINGLTDDQINKLDDRRLPGLGN